MYTAAQKKAQNVLEINNFLIHSMYVIHSIQKRQEVKYAIYNPRSALSGRLQQYMGGMVVIPYADSITQRLDLVSVTEQLCVKARDKMRPPLSQSSNFSI